MSWHRWLPTSTRWRKRFNCSSTVSAVCLATSLTNSRSPLARLNVALELARQRSGVEATSALERIQREAEILNEMIGQLLALTRLESGAEEIRKVELDLESLVREVVKDADFEARARNRSVRLAATEPVRIDGVPNLIRRAIENVIRNAVHYTAEQTEVEIKLFTDSAGTPPVGRQTRQ